MPTYEYKCLSCNRHFDAFQSMKDDPYTTCKECGGKLKRLIGTGAGIIFKGSGFYETDYRSSDYQSSQKKDKDTSQPASSEKKSTDSTSPKTSEKTQSNSKEK